MRVILLVLGQRQPNKGYTVKDKKDAGSKINELTIAQLVSVRDQALRTLDAISIEIARRDTLVKDAEEHSEVE